MQAESVSTLPGGEAMREDSGEILRRYSYPRVLHCDADTVLALAVDADANPPVGVAAILHGLLRVAQKIQHDLQHVVLHDGYWGYLLVVALQANLMALKR